MNAKIRQSQYFDTIEIEGEKIMRTPCGSECGEEGDYVLDELATCIQCGSPTGNLHAIGCENEQCPNCKDQLVSCGCIPPSSDFWKLK